LHFNITAGCIEETRTPQAAAPPAQAARRSDVESFESLRAAREAPSRQRRDGYWCHSTHLLRRIPAPGLSSPMPQRSYAVYILSSVSRTLYTGVTNNLGRRVNEHKQGKPGSFTTRYNVTRLVYVERFHEIRDAIAREKAIKRMYRKEKIRLIESINPEWRDLSEG
jgi:putative endonuclease